MPEKDELMDQNKFSNRGKPGPDPKKDGRRPPEDNSRVIFFVFLVLGFFMLVQIFSWPKEVSRLSYSQFYEMVVNNLETNQIVEAELTENLLRGRFADGKDFTIYVPQNDVQLIPLLSRNIPNFYIKAPNEFLRNVFYSVLPMVLFFILLYFFFYRGSSQGGGRLLSFGKSRAKQMGKDSNRMTFKDVAGVEEAKQELVEIIEFLKDPKKFQKLGGKIPKGVLLMGPPGTGKTLLAKAVAGEADVPFFSISGSDFVEMFVGVGASRVRDLFEQAKRSAKTSGKGAIIFVDEIDAVGRQRFAGIGGGHDEREQTLNALLVEMDGFNTNEAVILIGATNRPDVLDPALMRPGRFDRQIVVDRPNLTGREEILNVHIRGVKLNKDVDLKRLARQTPGFSGADLASLVNEAALLAARKNKKSVTQEELEEAIEKVMAGPERRSHVISKKERVVVAGHESGHALVSLLVDHADPLHKVSIIPRGKAALGYTLNVPLEDRYLVTEEELVDRITVALSGRVAEELLFKQVTTGAANDFEVATALARRMVCEFGMSKNMGPLTFGRKQHEVFLGRDIMDEQNYSDETALLIDREVRRIMDACYDRARTLLTEHRQQLESLMEALLEHEVLDGEEVCAITGIVSKAPAPEDAASVMKTESHQEDDDLVDEDDEHSSGDDDVADQITKV